MHDSDKGVLLGYYQIENRSKSDHDQTKIVQRGTLHFMFDTLSIEISGRRKNIMTDRK